MCGKGNMKTRLERPSPVDQITDTSTRMLWEFSFLFRLILFPRENSKTNWCLDYLTKENGQSILVLVVYDVIIQVAY